MNLEKLFAIGPRFFIIVLTASLTLILDGDIKKYIITYRWTQLHLDLILDGTTKHLLTLPLQHTINMQMALCKIRHLY